MPRQAMIALALLLATLAARGLPAGEDLAAGFADPPEAAKPWVYWWWLDSNASKEGITRDLQEMKRQGIGGALVFDAGQGHTSPVGPKFMSDGWRELFRHAVREADRVGLKLSFNKGPNIHLHVRAGTHPTGSPVMERKPMGAGDYVIDALFAATILAITAQVLWRYAFRDALPWTEELARYLFIWITFLGAALAVRDGTHIRVSLLVERLPARWRRYVEAGGLALMVLLMGFLVCVGAWWVWTNRGTWATTLKLPLSYAVYSALPAAMALGICFALRRAIKSLRGKQAQPPPPSEAEAF